MKPISQRISKVLALHRYRYGQPEELWIGPAEAQELEAFVSTLVTRLSDSMAPDAGKAKVVEGATFMNLTIHLMKNNGIRMGKTAGEITE